MFKERFKKLREEKGLTQSQLAEELNIARTSISNYELGTRRPDIDVLITVADYFKVTTDYLTGRSELKTFEEELEHKTTLSKLGIKNDTLSLSNKEREKIINSINILYDSLVKFFSSHASENRMLDSQLNGGDIILEIILSLSSIINKCSILHGFSAYDYEYKDLINSLNISDTIIDNDINESGREPSQINFKIDSKAFEDIRKSRKKLGDLVISSNLVQLTNVLLGIQNSIILDLSNIQKIYTPKNSYY